MNMTLSEYALQAKLSAGQVDEIKKVLGPTPDDRPFEEWSYTVSRILDDLTFSGDSTWPGQDLRRSLVTGVYDPQDLGVADVELALAVPEGATHAMVIVNSGAVRIGARRADTAALLVTGDSVTVSGLQLPALRLKCDAGQSAQVRIDY